MKHFSVIKTLQTMTKTDIDYFVIRGFNPLIQLEQDGDIDLYVNPKDRRKVHNFLVSLGFYTPFFNPTRYPHVQYILLKNAKVYRIDIQFDFLFGNNLLRPKNLELGSHIDHGVRIANPTCALQLLLYHILFDKRELSRTNKTRLLESVRIYPASDELVANAKSILRAKSPLNEIAKAWRAELSYNPLRKLWRQHIIRKLFKIGYALHKYFHNRTIAIVGIDGSGKSTTIESLQKTIPDKLRIQYMGNKDFKSKLAKTYTYKNHKLIALPITYLAMWSRIISGLTKPQITIFDRYSWETYYLASRPAKPLFFFPYFFLPPKPKLVYYLHCPLETSLARKDDIDDKQQFALMKQKTDTFYKNRRNIVSFDTATIPTAKIVDRILNDLNAHMLPYFF